MVFPGLYPANARSLRTNNKVTRITCTIRVIYSQCTLCKVQNGHAWTEWVLIIDSIFYIKEVLDKLPEWCWTAGQWMSRCHGSMSTSSQNTQWTNFLLMSLNRFQFLFCLQIWFHHQFWHHKRHLNDWEITIGVTTNGWIYSSWCHKVYTIVLLLVSVLSVQDLTRFVSNFITTSCDESLLL